MAEQVGAIFYTVDFETAKLTTAADKINAALAQAEKSAGKMDDAFSRVGKSANDAAKNGLDATGRSLDTVTSKAGSAQKSVTRFSNTLGGVKSTAGSSLDDAAKAIGDAAKASDDANDPIAKLANEMAEGTNRANGFSFSMSALAQAIAAVAFSSALMGIASMVQKYQEMAERVQMATSSTEEFNDVQARLLNTANGTYRSLQEAQELYIATANSLRSMGYSTQQALDVTDSMSYSFVKNATSADKASGAIDAFAKSINTGKVGADQWETLTSAIPSVIDDIAAASGKSAADIRALGAAGKITAQQLTEGLRASLDANAKAAAAMSNNLVDASVRSKTALTAFFVSVENQTGYLDKLTAAIIMAADNLLAFSANSGGVSTAMTAVTSSAAILAAVIAGRLVGAIAGYTTAKVGLLASTLAQIKADQTAAGAALVLARANETAAATALVTARAAETAAVGLAHHAAAANALAIAEAEAVLATQSLNAAMAASATVATRTALAVTGLKNVMAFLGGPVGVILIAAAALYYFAKAATDTQVDVDRLNKSLDKLTFNQLSKSANDVGDDIAKLNKKLSAAYSDFNTLSKRPWENNDDFTKRQVEARAAIDDVNQELEKRRDALAKIAEAQDKIKNPVAAKPAAVTAPVLPEDADSAKVIQGLKDQESLLKVIGVERAKLAAIQKLGEGASPEQRLEAEALAASIYKLQQAEASQKASKKKGESEAAAAAKKAAADEKKGIEDNQKAFSELGLDIANVGKTARETAMDAAQLSLNQYATPEQIQTIRAMAAALYDLKTGKELLAKVDPIAAESQNYGTQLEQLQALNDQKLLSDQRYLELKGQAETAHEAAMTALQEERFRKQSKGNELLMASLDQVQAAGANAFVGLITGASSGQQAVQALASSILNEAVGAVVAYGVAQLKSLIIGQSAGAAATAATVAEAGIAATAWATPAALASLATLGSNAVPAGAAISGTVALSQGLALGARQYGGPVDTSKMYRVNEGGAPEIFNAAGGKQYMMPNTRGEVVSNKDATSGSSAGGAVTVNVNNSNGSNVRVNQRQLDRQQIIDVFVEDISTGGKTRKMVNQVTGTNSRGS